MRFLNNLLAVILAACVAVPLGAAAQGTDKCKPDTFGERFTVRYKDACWRTDAALAERANAIEKAFDKAPEISIARVRAAEEQAKAQEGRLPKPGDQPASEKLLALLAQGVKEAIDNLGALTDLRHIDVGTATTANYPALRLEYWQPFDNTRRGYGQHYLQQQNCATKGDEDATCARVYAKAVEIGDSMLLMLYTVETLRLPLRAELKQELDRRKARWNSYLYDSQFQYWWELGLNRWLEEKCPGGLNKYVSDWLDRDAECRGLKRDEFGNQLEWREPPSFRAIALHPDIGFMYDQNASEGDKAKVALVFQWFGYQWWKWDESTNRVKNLRGISLVSTIADRIDNNVGLGVQVQYNKYNLAVTSHGGKPIFTLSLNLLERLGSVDDELGDKLRRRLAP